MTVISATLKCLRCKAPLPYAEVSIYVPFCAPCWSGIIAGVGKAFGDAFQEFKTQLDRVIERQREELRLAIEEGRIHDAVYVRAEETEEPDIAGAGQGPRPGSLELRSNIPLPPVEIERVMAEKHITELE